MAEQPLRLIEPTDREPYERISAVIRPEFDVDVYFPQTGDTALVGTSCTVLDCQGWDSHGSPPICAEHRKRLRARRSRDRELSRETFVAAPELHGGPVPFNHPGFDFRDLPDRLQLELRLLVQTRRDENRTLLRRHELQTIRNAAQGAGLTSLFEGLPSVTDRIYMSSTPVPACIEKASGQVRAHTRFAISIAAEVGWPLSLMERDRWYCHEFGFEEARVKTLTFSGYASQWVKEWVKQWIKYRLDTGIKWSSAIGGGGRLLPFARFINEHYPSLDGPHHLSRDLLLEYIGWVNRQSDIAQSQRQGLVSQVKILLEDHRVNGWTPALPESAVIRRGELPKRDEALPRPIPDSIHKQMFSKEGLALIPRSDIRLMIMLANDHGFRAGTVVSLEIDCLTEDADGFPALRYWNRKRTRERMHPIRNPELPILIREQQNVARSRHPETPWLFPKAVGNASGARHQPANTLNYQLQTWLGKLNLTTPDGQPVRVTLHQFRHTFGTRELNNGVSQEVVQELLDHEDAAMTRTYARLSNKNLRIEFLKGDRFNVMGERLEELLPDSPLSDLAWMKEQMNRARVTLPNGYCGMPLQQTCDVQNACLDCADYFITTPEFLPQHEQQRDRTKVLIAEAERDGHTRVAERNRVTLIKLDRLVASLRTAGAPS